MSVALCAPGASNAQTSASIEGCVFDLTGAVIPDAVIRVQNDSMGFDASVRTDAGGRYYIVALSAGTYNVTAEAIGTAFFLAAIVGSGIMADRLAAGNGAVALLANTLATATTLVTLILVLGPISGAHFNPLVTLLARMRGQLPGSEAGAYLLAQIAGAFAGVVIAHVMFGEPLLAASEHERSGASQMVAEGVATFGLLMVVGLTTKLRPEFVAVAVGAYIAGAYWFTSSTSFANPAVTLARSMTNTFAGIRPADVPGFLGGQFVGGLLAIVTVRWFSTDRSS
jgi:glycerol uptake facilitator-like aquaporin